MDFGEKLTIQVRAPRPYIANGLAEDPGPILTEGPQYTYIDNQHFPAKDYYTPLDSEAFDPVAPVPSRLGFTFVTRLSWSAVNKPDDPESSYLGLNQQHIRISYTSHQPQVYETPASIEEACNLLGIWQGYAFNKAQIQERYQQLRDELYAQGTVYGIWMSEDAEKKWRKIETAFEVLMALERDVLIRKAMETKARMKRGARKVSVEGLDNVEEDLEEVEAKTNADGGVDGDSAALIKKRMRAKRANKVPTKSESAIDNPDKLNLTSTDVAAKSKPAITKKAPVKRAKKTGIPMKTSESDELNTTSPDAAEEEVRVANKKVPEKKATSTKAYSASCNSDKSKTTFPETTSSDRTANSDAIATSRKAPGKQARKISTDDPMSENLPKDPAKKARNTTATVSQGKSSVKKAIKPRAQRRRAEITTKPMTIRIKKVQKRGSSEDFSDAESPDMKRAKLSGSSDGERRRDTEIRSDSSLRLQLHKVESNSVSSKTGRKMGSGLARLE
jgi:hypothetical protein